jgi:hypothetical protein
VHAPIVPASLPLQIVIRFWRNRVSVVDQRALLAPGRVRRLLVRVLLVLGGAFAVTVVGWLLCAGSANADELPTVPSVPAVLAGIDKATHLSTPDIQPAGLPASPLPDTGLGKVAQQVRLTVPDVAAKIAPAVPVVDITPVVAPASKPVGQPRTVVREVAPEQVAAPAPVAAPASVPFRHVVTGGMTERRASRSTVPAPTGAAPHRPALPPLQPAGSPDSSAHGTGGFADGSGGAQAPFTPVLGNGLNLVGMPSTPRLAVVPGAQPGSSPD